MLDFIGSQVKEDKPFLAVIWFGSPHSPHIASEQNRALYPNETKQRANYLGEVTGIDTAMGKLRKELGHLGVADSTLLWYTSDNGAQGPEGVRGSSGGLRGKKGTLWEGGVRVPTIIEWPSVISKNRITNVPCNTVDIYPTVLDLLGLKMKDQPILDGVSILPLIEGKPFERNKPLGFWDYAAGGTPRRADNLLAALKKEQETGAKPVRMSRKRERSPNSMHSTTMQAPPLGWRDRGSCYVYLKKRRTVLRLNIICSIWRKIATKKPILSTIIPIG